MNLNQLVSKNQTIKIVPSFEESLRCYGLNVDLEENTTQWLEQLKITWKTWKKSSAVINHIEHFFSSVPDPFRIGLVFAVKCEEFKDCKPKTLPYFIIESLQKWSQTNAILPDDSIKLPAFHVAIQQRNQHFLTMVVKTYQISSIKATILPLVREIIKNDSNKQVTQIVIAMELFDDIPVEDLLFPLILQDKTSMVDEYLIECPHQVKPLLLFLDTLLDKSISLREYVQKYIEENNIGHIKYDKIHHKPLGKLVARLCNKFNIPIETCKNLSKNRTTGGLRYLIHQKYQEHNVSSSVWEDLVKDSLKNNAGSGQEFIDMLLDYDRKEALKWAEYLKIPENELPLSLKGVSLEDNYAEENWDRDISNHTYYKTSITNDQIVMINTSESFYDMMVSDLCGCNIVSIDCEWKPSFGATQSQVALIQIATANKIYLIDTLALNKQEYSSFWYKFNKSLLDNGEIIKIGFGLEQDLKEIKASVVGLSNIKVKGEGLLDLSILWRNLIDTGLTLSSNSENGGNGLSSLVQSCFGSPLEKSEQCSNWELRPLRDTQIYYAALDAYVLLELYIFLQKICPEQGIHFEEICNDVMLEGKKKSGKKPKSLEMQQVQTENHHNPAQKFKLLVEPPLSHLMSYLRYCGIDTTVMPLTMLWHDVINLAISEERHVVLSKFKHTPTVNYHQSSILDVGKGSIKDHLQKIICTFNIKIQQSDLLTRCINCNEKDLKELELTEVSNICSNYLSTSSFKPQSKRYTNDYDDDDDYSNFLSDSDCDEYYCKPLDIASRHKNCKTSRGADIDIQNAEKLAQSQKSAVLCESCGKLFWDEDESLKSVVDLIFNITKIRT